MSNRAVHWLDGAPPLPTFGEIEKDVLRLAAHIDGRTPVAEGQPAAKAQSGMVAELTAGWRETYPLTTARTTKLGEWLKAAVPLIDESDASEEARLDRLRLAIGKDAERAEALAYLQRRLPLFVLFSNYFRVRPLIHLSHLAQRLSSKILDDAQYDYGNLCLLKLLGFTAKDLSDLGNVVEPTPVQPGQLQKDPGSAGQAVLSAERRKRAAHQGDPIGLAAEQHAAGSGQAEGCGGRPIPEGGRRGRPRRRG